MPVVKKKRLNIYVGVMMTNNYERADFSNKKMKDSDWKENNLKNANFTATNLTRASFAGANLEGANLTKADCTDAYFGLASMVRADFKETKLINTDFTNAVLIGAKNIPEDANLTGAITTTKQLSSALKETNLDKLVQDTYEKAATSIAKNPSGRDISQEDIKFFSDIGTKENNKSHSFVQKLFDNGKSAVQRG